MLQNVEFTLKQKLIAFYLPFKINKCIKIQKQKMF